MKLFMKNIWHILLPLLLVATATATAPSGEANRKTKNTASSNNNNSSSKNNSASSSNSSNSSGSGSGNSSINITNSTCKHPTDMWGDANPNIFYICDVVEQIPLQLRCPEGHGFFNGHGYLGCLPYAQWPACLPAAQTLAAQLAAGCDNNGSGSSSISASTTTQPQKQQQEQQQQQQQQQPWPTLDPNKFYMCPGIAATPLLLSCAAGKGFVQTSEIVGCADWMLWREQMQCQAYY